MLKQKSEGTFFPRFHLKGQKRKKLIRLNTFFGDGPAAKKERKPLKLEERSNKFTSNIFFQF